jgi:hypothetical protein
VSRESATCQSHLHWQSIHSLRESSEVLSARAQVGDSSRFPGIAGFCNGRGFVERVVLGS